VVEARGSRASYRRCLRLRRGKAYRSFAVPSCTQENGPTADGDRMVTVWWLKMETTSPEPPAVAADLCGHHYARQGRPAARTPAAYMDAVPPSHPCLKGHHDPNITFEVCITDCPKSWSGLLAFAAARVLGITEVAALLAFVAAEEMLFSEESGIVWAAEPQLDFFVSFIDLAMLDVQLPHVHLQACTWNLVVPVLYILR